MIILENGYDYCLHSDLIDDKGVLICRTCGLIIKEDNLVVQRERVYNQEEARNTTHLDTIKDVFFSRRTIFKPKDIRSTSKEVGKYIRMDKLDKWNIDRKNTKSIEVKYKIKSYLEYNKMSGNRNILRKTNYILHKVGDYNIRGKSLNLFAASLLVYILRTSRIPCNIKKLLSFYGIKKKMSVFTMLNDIIKKYNLPEMFDLRLRDYVSWYLYELEMDNLMVPEDIILLLNNGIYYADLMEEYSIGKSKSCNVSGILHFIFKNNGIRINQEEIANCIGVTSASLRRAVKDLKELITLDKDEIS